MNINTAIKFILSSVAFFMIIACGKTAEKESGKRNPTNALEELIFTMYGNPPPTNTAITELAAELAYEKLLLQKVPKDRVLKIAEEQNADEMPYTTEDLALTVALTIFRRPEWIDRKKALFETQMTARMQAAAWYSEGKANAYLVETFENILHERYRPDLE